MNIPKYYRKQLGKGIRGKYFKTYKERKKKIFSLLFAKLKLPYRNKER